MVPDGWHLHKIDSLLASCVYGISKSLSNEPIGIPVLRMGNIQNGRLDLSNLKYADIFNEVEELVTLRPGDVVFYRTNSKDLVGKVAIVDTDLALSFASYLLRLRVKKDEIEPYWFYYCLAAPDMQQTLRSIATLGVSQCNINRFHNWS